MTKKIYSPLPKKTKEDYSNQSNPDEQHNNTITDKQSINYI